MKQEKYKKPKENNIKYKGSNNIQREKREKMLQVKYNKTNIRKIRQKIVEV